VRAALFATVLAVASEAHKRRIRREIDKYVAAVAKADDVAELVTALRQRKEQLGELERQQAALVSPVLRLTPFEVCELCGDVLRQFSAMLAADVRAARQALRTLLPAPLRLRPATVEGRRTLAFEGETTLGPILQNAWRPHADSKPGYRRERDIFSSTVGAPRYRLRQVGSSNSGGPSCRRLAVTRQYSYFHSRQPRNIGK
jgi:hypothetical protein